MKWLEMLNHEHFPSIDTEIIKWLGLGNLINKQIKTKWKALAPLTTLTGSIEQKWYRFAKREKEAHSKRSRSKKVIFPDDRQKCEEQIRFKRGDKPSQLLPHHRRGQTAGDGAEHHIQSILKNTNTAAPEPDAVYDDHQPPQFGDESDDSDNEYTLEYVEDHDVEMSTNDDTDDDGGDEIDFMIDEVPWHCPLLMQIENGRNVLQTECVLAEEERVRHKEWVPGPDCIELESSNAVSHGVNATEVMIQTDYPHWSEIEKYRAENNIY